MTGLRKPVFLSPWTLVSILSVSPQALCLSASLSSLASDSPPLSKRMQLREC